MYSIDLSDDALKDLLEDGPIRVQSLGDLEHLAARLPGWTNGSTRWR